jgi:hypothetical protein
MLDALKGWAITIGTVVAVITVAVFLILGPVEAADFLKWIGEILSGLGVKVQEFIQQFKQA